MLVTVKSLTKFAVPGFLLLFTGICFPQSAAKTQKAPTKASSPAAAAEAKPQAKSEEEDEVIPPSDPNAIFPALVARINGKPILGRDLERMVRGELLPLGSPEWKNLREDYRSELVLNLLATLINQKLIYQKAAANGIKPTEAEVQAELQRIAKTFESDAEMNAALANRMMDRATLEKGVYENLSVAKYVEENVNKKITVTPEELAKYYTSHPTEFHHPDIVRTSHILIPAGENAEKDALAKQRAEALLARAKKGEDFAKLARENSTDSSASEGGDVGFSSKEALVAEYGKAAFSLPVEGVALVKTKAGYYIIKVTDKKEEGLATLEEVKPELTEFLKNQKYEESLAKLVSQLRDEAKIEILIPFGQPLKP
jgi:parvulin-like peptidyl-prolyl isomerase